jgi:hypothetical protein
MLDCSLEVSKQKCQLLFQLVFDAIDWPDLTGYSWVAEAEKLRTYG